LSTIHIGTINDGASKKIRKLLNQRATGTPKEKGYDRKRDKRATEEIKDDLS
jgi:hypothetical protein